MNINKLNFEIKGTGFINKGSYLMMLSIIEKLEENFPDCNIGLSIMRGSYNEREQLGLGHILRYESKKFPFINNLFGFGSFIPQIVRKYFNLLLDSDIDVILDASGFQYSSQWGNKETELMAKMANIWHRQGKKIILMPQAFGPFTDLQIKSDMIQIFNNSDLIFIRDNVSMKYVKEIIKISDEKFYLYPDFTNLYKVNKKLISNKFKGSVCIIPNSRMIDKKNNNYQLYLNFFKLIIDYFILNDIKFYFLIHSSDERKSKISDLDIIKLLIEDDDIHIDIVKLEDPKLIKMQISNSKFIISSRFHGLINGLSQNIPSIATSWSHKYKELLGLYDLEHLCIYDLSNKQRIIDLLNDFNKSEVLNGIIDKLRKKNKLLESKTKEMWKMINNTIIS